MKIIAEKVKVKDLQAGDLFSIAGSAYWDNCYKNGSVAEKVYIRTVNPPIDNSEDNETVFRITIER